MVNEIEVFKNNEFGEIRTVVVNDEPMFCLADVCNAIEISNPTMVAQRLDDDERTKLDLGRAGETNFVTESGLYAVILRSDKPAAKKFRKWVTSEVLPSIRKTGTYSMERKYQPKATSVGEVANLLKILERTMKAEKQSPEIIAENIEQVCRQFGIELSEDFTKRDNSGQLAFVIVGVK